MYRISFCFFSVTAYARHSGEFIYVSLENALEVAEKVSLGEDIIGHVYVLKDLTGEVIADFYNGELTYKDSSVKA